jgi:uncharacterized phage protein (TIGR01671 family)
MQLLVQKLKTNKVMRKNEYRGKRVDNGEWVYGHYFTTPLTAEYNILPENGAFFDSGLSTRRCVIADENGVVFEIIPRSLGQLTGILDINGNKIYEGDIIECCHEIRHQVLFSKECSSLCQYGIEKNGTGEYFNHGYITQYYVNEFKKSVIGNIHDNPELIKYEP